MRQYSLGVGGLLGSFFSSCVVASGGVGMEHIIYALFLVSVTSCMALILDVRKHRCDSAGDIFSLPLQSLDNLVRIGFGAGLAGTFIYGFSQVTALIADYFAMPLVTATAICTLLLISYASFVVLLVIVGKERYARQRGYFGYY